MSGHWTDELLERVDKRSQDERRKLCSANFLVAENCLEWLEDEFAAQADFVGLLMDEVERLRVANLEAIPLDLDLLLMQQKDKIVRKLGQEIDSLRAEITRLENELFTAYSHLAGGDDES